MGEFVYPLFCDFDGCLTPPQKIWLPAEKKDYCGAPEFAAQYRQIVGAFGKVAKPISDYDSHILSYEFIQQRVVFITADTRINPEWCEQHNVRCIVDKHDKYDAICEYWEKHWKENDWAEFPECAYYYLGDSMPDYECLEKAHRAFIPQCCSQWLRTKLICNDVQYTYLDRSGGEGCLEETILRICQAGDWEEFDL